MDNHSEGLRAFVSEWLAAERDGDVAALDRFLADDFTGVGPLGFLLSRKEWLQRHVAGDLKYRALDVDEVQTRHYDCADVVVARQRAQGAYRGNELPGDLRATLLVVGEPNARRLAGVHLSFMAGTPGAPAIPGRPGPGGGGTGGVSNG